MPLGLAEVLLCLVTWVILENRTPLFSNDSGSPASLPICSQFFRTKGLKKKYQAVEGKQEMSTPTQFCVPANTQSSPAEGKEEDFVSLFNFQMELLPTGDPHTQMAYVTVVTSVADRRTLGTRKSTTRSKSEKAS